MKLITEIIGNRRIEYLSDESIIERLMRFNLTEEEARVYLCLPKIKNLNAEGIAEEMRLDIEEVRRILRNLEGKGFVKSYMLGIYLPTTPIEALNKRLETILSELNKLKSDMIEVLQTRFILGRLVACSFDRAHFNIFVDELTKAATNSICISTKELKFIEESDFINTLEKNTRLRVRSVKILLTTNAGTPDLGDIISRLKVLNKCQKVWVKHNASRTELRYMTIDQKKVLLVEADHKNAVIIESAEVAQYFDSNFEVYFNGGRDVSTILELVKDITTPEHKDEEVRKRWFTVGLI